MAKPFQLKRNTTVKSDAFTGKPYELTLDCERQELRIHDGINAGGFAVARTADLKQSTRVSHTQYQVGDVVACPKRAGIYLVCSEAGQTLNGDKDFSKAAVGSTVVDGTVSWIVTAPFVTSVNGQSGDVTIGNASSVSSGLMSAADKKKLDNLDENLESYTLPVAGYGTLGGVMTTSDVVDVSGMVACPIVDGVPYYKGSSAKNELTSFGITATASEINVLSGSVITTKELNHLRGLTSDIQYQLDSKLNTTATAAKAMADEYGNNIAYTYAEKSALSSGLAGKAEKNHGHSEATASSSGFMSSSDKAKLGGIEAKANNYVHPSHTAKSNGFYKVTVDSQGHVSGTASVTKSDITALGIPAQDTTYSNATESDGGLMTASDKKKLNSIESGANKYVLPPTLPGLLGGVKVGSNITLKEGEISLSFNDVVNALGWVPLKTVNSHEADQYGNVDVSAGFFETDGIKTARLGDETNAKDKYVYVPNGGQWFCFGYVTEYEDGTDGDYDITTYHVPAGLYAGGARFPGIQRGSGYWDVNNVICLRNAEGEWE